MGFSFIRHWLFAKRRPHRIPHTHMRTSTIYEYMQLNIINKVVECWIFPTVIGAQNGGYVWMLKYLMIDFRPLELVINVYCWGLFNVVFISIVLFARMTMYALFFSCSVSLFFRGHRFLTDRESIFTSFHDILNSCFSVSARNKIYTLVALGIRVFYLKFFLFFLSYW